MLKFFAAVKPFISRKEEGATMVEYALMLALIAVVCLGAVAALGLAVQGLFNSIAGSI